MKLPRSRLFDYPLPDLQNTLYQKLSIFPEASEDEVREAESREADRLTRAKAEIDKQIAEIQAKVEGLQQTSKSVEELRRSGSDAATLNEGEKKLAVLEEAALSINPNYQQLIKTSKELSSQINDINVLSLANPEKRFLYDQKTPPCALLKLEKDEPEVFMEKGRRLALHLLRIELSEFLEAKGEKCFHPSDLTREDFYTDFIYTPLLDDVSLHPSQTDDL